jgi:hypothetical protein
MIDTTTDRDSQATKGTGDLNSARSSLRNAAIQTSNPNDTFLPDIGKSESDQSAGVGRAAAKAPVVQRLGD